MNGGPGTGPPSLFLAPHNDDEALFGAYLIQQHRPHVVVCFRSAKQGADTWEVREQETSRALDYLGVEEWEQLPHPDTLGVADARSALAVDLARLGLTHEPQTVFAPWPEPDGHEQHNIVGELANLIFGPERVVHYTTYGRGRGRTVGRREIDPWDGQQIAAKLAALSCYVSQIAEPSTRPWFTSLLDLREWTV